MPFWGAVSISGRVFLHTLGMDKIKTTCFTYFFVARNNIPWIIYLFNKWCFHPTIPSDAGIIYLNEAISLTSWGCNLSFLPWQVVAIVWRKLAVSHKRRASHGGWWLGGYPFDFCVSFQAKRCGLRRWRILCVDVTSSDLFCFSLVSDTCTFKKGNFRFKVGP